MFKQVILAVVLFYVVSNPATYKLVDNLLGSYIRIAKNGSPTSSGLLIHTLVFGAILVFLLPNISGLVHTHEHEHGPDGLTKHTHDIVKNLVPESTLKTMKDNEIKELIDKVRVTAMQDLSRDVAELEKMKERIDNDAKEEIRSITEKIVNIRKDVEKQIQREIDRIKALNTTQSFVPSTDDVIGGPLGGLPGLPDKFPFKDDVIGGPGDLPGLPGKFPFKDKNMTFAQFMGR